MKSIKNRNPDCVNPDLSDRNWISRVVTRIGLAITIVVQVPGTLYVHADDTTVKKCEVIRGQRAVNMQSCVCNAGQCGSILYMFDHRLCDGVMPGEPGQDGGCVPTVDVVAIRMQCDSNPNYYALLVWTGTFTLCAWACLSASTNPLSFWKCVACITTSSGAPIALACNFTICTQGERWEDVFNNVAESISGNPCVGSSTTPTGG